MLQIDQKILFTALGFLAVILNDVPQDKQALRAAEAAKTVEAQTETESKTTTIDPAAQNELLKRGDVSHQISGEATEQTKGQTEERTESVTEVAQDGIKNEAQSRIDTYIERISGEKDLSPEQASQLRERLEARLDDPDQAYKLNAGLEMAELRQAATENGYYDKALEYIHARGHYLENIGVTETYQEEESLLQGENEDLPDDRQAANIRARGYIVAETRASRNVLDGLATPEEAAREERSEKSEIAERAAEVEGKGYGEKTKEDKELEEIESVLQSHGFSMGGGFGGGGAAMAPCYYAPVFAAPTL